MGHTLVTCSGEVNLKNELNEWGLTLCHSMFSKKLPWNCYGCENTPSTSVMTTWRFINASYISIGCICFRTHSVFPAFRRNRLHANTQSIIFLCHLLWHPEICMVREYAYMLMSSLSIVKYFAYKLAPVPYRNMYMINIQSPYFLCTNCGGLREIPANLLLCDYLFEALCKRRYQKWWFYLKELRCFHSGV